MVIFRHFPGSDGTEAQVLPGREQMLGRDDPGSLTVSSAVYSMLVILDHVGCGLDDLP